MLKTLRIATILTGVSAFAIPALAQTEEPVVPGSETAVEEQEAETRDATAASPGSEADAPVANPDAETTVPGSDTGETENEEMDRAVTAEEPAGGAEAESGDGPLVPGSGATFTPGNDAEGEAEALQDETTDSAQ